MHVITRKALKEFGIKHPDAGEPLERWYKIIHKGDFTNFVELKSMFPSADLVGDRIVFNIGGNKYRLIASVRFQRRKVFIKEILTHHEYDRGTWKD